MYIPAECKYLARFAFVQVVYVDSSGVVASSTPDNNYEERRVASSVAFLSIVIFCWAVYGVP